MSGLRVPYFKEKRNATHASKKRHGQHSTHICFEVQNLFRSVDRSTDYSADVQLVRICILPLLRFFVPWTAAVDELKRDPSAWIDTEFVRPVCECLAACRT